MLLFILESSDACRPAIFYIRIKLFYYFKTQPIKVLRNTQSNHLNYNHKKLFESINEKYNLEPLKSELKKAIYQNARILSNLLYCA